MLYNKASERLLLVAIGGTYQVVGCLTSNSIDESVEMLSTTTRDNNGWATARPTTQNYVITFSGIQDGEGVLTYSQLKALKRARTQVSWKLQGGTGTESDFGIGYITDLSETADAEAFLEFSGTITGFGQPVALGDNQKPTAPTLSPVTLNPSGYIYLQWTASTDNVGVVGYEVGYLEVYVPGSTIQVINVGIPTTGLEYYFYSVVNGYSYSFWVRAYDAAGNRSDWSNLRSIWNIVLTDTSESFLLEDGTVFTNQSGITFNI